jgi:hypothetical protein
MAPEKPRERPIEKSSSVPRHLSGEQPPGDRFHPAKPRAGAERTAVGVDKVAVRAAALGIPGPHEEGDTCVFRGHEHPAHLFYDGSHWSYWCPARDERLSLADVRAIDAYASVPGNRDRPEEIPRPGRVEVSRWAERLDHEAGLVERGSLRLVLPDDLSATAKQVAGNLELLLALRGIEWRDRDRFTFARRFCAAWCGLSEDRARAGIEELRQRRLIIRDGKARRGTLCYRLGSFLEVFGSEDVVFELVARAFDAVEVLGDDEPGAATWDFT